eukprot:SAG31_NODE_3162_length_4606_cov_22.721544_7_plen_132_part_01
MISNSSGAPVLQFGTTQVDSESVEEMRTLFEYAKHYGFADYLIFDASVVRGCETQPQLLWLVSLVSLIYQGYKVLAAKHLVLPRVVLSKSLRRTRRLSYYTGIVFECFDRRGELRAICGGGRYDRLLSLYGS